MKLHGSVRDRQRVLNVLTYAWQRLEDAIDSEGLAAQAGLSLTHFHRVFPQVTGETPQAHLRRLRPMRAGRTGGWPAAFDRTTDWQLAAEQWFEVFGGPDNSLCLLPDAWLGG